MSQMNRVIEIHEKDLDAVVQPGVTRTQLNDALRATGLIITVDPYADASMGGMASPRASGTNTVRYGTIRENVLALEVVLPDGEIIRTGSRARKSASGYDLTHLFIGVEAEVREQVEAVREIASDLGGVGFRLCRKGRRSQPPVGRAEPRLLLGQGAETRLPTGWSRLAGCRFRKWPAVSAGPSKPSRCRA
ncbi:FAD-binding protein [Paracoccus sp. Z330]|uniref:FAD-binding protein n=1 Tax=Paracoccus onchidii TaxID=3017813 RepID=A0ABT4ZJR2_9RHOB|nr:FAD-binding protein [Paracoccus onchidii]MDB6179608.1 FAD-binding protein [Paracoccus onchidii]